MCCCCLADVFFLSPFGFSVSNTESLTSESLFRRSSSSVNVLKCFFNCYCNECIGLIVVVFLISATYRYHSPSPLELFS